MKPGGRKLPDGTVVGLWLEPGARKGGGNWALIFTSPVTRTRREMGLGVYPSVSIKKARQEGARARLLIDEGKDPIEARKVAKEPATALPTFGDIAKLVITDAQAKSVNAKVRYQWERHLGPAYSIALLDRPVHEITTVEIARALAPVWRAKPEVARKLYPAIRRVFDRARVILRDEYGVEMNRNPAEWSDLKAMGFEKPRELSRGRHPSLPYEQMSEFMSALRARDAVSARLLEFLILTNVRMDTALKATWDQVDLDAALWTIPLANLKDREHRTEAFRVPLSSRAVAIVCEMEQARACAYVFAGQDGAGPLSNMAPLPFLKRLSSGERKWLDEDGRPITAHGFRATFRTWAEEVATVPHAVIEHAMGHRAAAGGKVERAYNRTDLLKKRRELMDAWARHCDPKHGADVIHLRPRSA
jgi:integrase